MYVFNKNSGYVQALNNPGLSSIFFFAADFFTRSGRERMWSPHVRRESDVLGYKINVSGIMRRENEAESCQKDKDMKPA